MRLALLVPSTVINRCGIYANRALGLKNPPEITWNDGLVRFLNAVTTQSTARRSSRARGNSAARPEDPEFDFSDFME